MCLYLGMNLLNNEYICVNLYLNKCVGNKSQQRLQCSLSTYDPFFDRSVVSLFNVSGNRNMVGPVDVDFRK